MSLCPLLLGLRISQTAGTIFDEPLGQKLGEISVIATCDRDYRESVGRVTRDVRDENRALASPRCNRTFSLCVPRTATGQVSERVHFCKLYEDSTSDSIVTTFVAEREEAIIGGRSVDSILATGNCDVPLENFRER